MQKKDIRQVYSLKKYGSKERFGADVENARNFQKELDKLLEQQEKNQENGKRLFLHSCCAPCSSYVLEYLRKYFRITVFYYNPNISFANEYKRRAAEQKRLIEAYNRQGIGYPIEVLEGDYEPEQFYQTAKGLEDCPEGGERCFLCYELRLRKTAELAQKGNYDYFATTLTISPLKNAKKLNEIGERLSQEYHVNWLVSDFKKKNGYKRSIELSAEYDLYRQDYCGCVYSKQEREKQKAERKNEA
ncbi:MAG: epoxyqueuosine reductase QueH [Lachnospiraceae bacterium]|nr:epoxyqueuosine reductase QueH [Lachnospiraceae bacterium]